MPRGGCHSEVSSESDKNKAESIYALSIASASINGLAFLTAAPLFWMSAKDSEYKSWHVNKRASFAIAFAENFLTAQMLLLTGLQVGAGVHSYELKSSTSPNLSNFRMENNPPLEGYDCLEWISNSRFFRDSIAWIRDDDEVSLFSKNRMLDMRKAKSKL